MLTQICCAACRLESLWTDDPKGFLRGVCSRPGNCTAMMIAEPATEARKKPKAAPVRDPRRAPARQPLAS